MATAITYQRSSLDEWFEEHLFSRRPRRLTLASRSIVRSSHLSSGDDRLTENTKTPGRRRSCNPISPAETTDWLRTQRHQEEGHLIAVSRHWWGCSTITSLIWPFSTGENIPECCQSFHTIQKHFRTSWNLRTLWPFSEHFRTFWTFWNIAEHVFSVAECGTITGVWTVALGSALDQGVKTGGRHGQTGGSCVYLKLWVVLL